MAKVSAQPVKTPSKELVVGPAPVAASELKEFHKLSMEEQQLKIVEHNLKTYGTITPPPEVAYTLMRKRCPNCEKTKSIIPDFGLARHPDGRLRPNGWCRACRNEPKSVRAMNPKRIKTPRFSTLHLRAMTPEERKQYIAVYESVSKRVGEAAPENDE